MAKEYIERDAAKRAIMSQYLSRANKTKYADVIDAVPAADVVPVRHGRWIEEDDSCCGFHATDIVCSECNKISEFGKFAYCPNCGARMEG